MSFSKSTRLWGILVATVSAGCSSGEFSDCTATATCANAGAAGNSSGGSGGIGTGGSSGGYGGSAGNPSGAAGGGGAGGAPATTNPVAVFVQSSAGEPVQGATVVSQDANGVLVEQGTTNDNGAVSLNVSEGGAVTALGIIHYQQGGVSKTLNSLATAMELPKITTIHLYLAEVTRDLSPISGSTSTLNVTPTTTIATPDANATLVLPCTPLNAYASPWGQPYVIGSFRGCTDGTTFDVWAFAFKGGNLAAWGSSTSQTFTAGASVNIAVSADNTAITKYEIDATDVPAGATFLRANVLGVRSSQPVPIIRGAGIPTPAASQIISVLAPSASWLSSTLKADVSFPVGTRTGSAGLFRAPTTAAQTQAWNVTSDLALFETRSAYDHTEVGRPSVDWTLSATGALGDYVRANFSWEDRDWSVIVPAARTGHVQPLSLPAPLQQYAPSLGEPIGAGSAAVSLYDALNATGYGEALSSDRSQTDVNYSNLN